MQNNGTPSSTAPIAAAAQDDDDEEERRLAAAQAQPGSTSPESVAAAAASQQLFWQSCEDGRPGPCQQLNTDGLESRHAAAGAGSAHPACAEVRCAGGAGCEQSVLRSSAGASGSLSSSPGRRGGIPQPPGSRVQACSINAVCSLGQRGGGAVPVQPQQPASQQPWQVSLQHQPVPGTPPTPVGAWPGGCLSKQPSSSGFPRSVSVDSENPSLGFGMREALANLRCAHKLGPSTLQWCRSRSRQPWQRCPTPLPSSMLHVQHPPCLCAHRPVCPRRMGAAAGGDGAPHRGPQALADLFREDSSADVAALDVSEHLAALALPAGDESPGAPALPRVVEASSSAEGEAGLGLGSRPAAQQTSAAANGQQQQGREERQRPDGQRHSQPQAPRQQGPPLAGSPGRGPAHGQASSKPGGRRSGGDGKGKCRLM